MNERVSSSVSMGQEAGSTATLEEEDEDGQGQHKVQQRKDHRRLSF